MRRMRNRARSCLPNASGFARMACGQRGRGRYGADVRSAPRFGGCGHSSRIRAAIKSERTDRRADGALPLAPNAPLRMLADCIPARLSSRDIFLWGGPHRRRASPAAACAPETISPLPRFNSETFAASGHPRFAASDCGAPPGMALREMVRSLHIPGCCRRAGRPNRIDVRMPMVREYFNRGQENEKRSNRNAPCCKHEAPNISGAQPTSARGDLITLGTESRPTIRVRFNCPSHACVVRMATRPGAVRRH